MKKIEKWLTQPLLQRIVYLVLLLFWLYINNSNGNFNRLLIPNSFGTPYGVLVFLPALLLAAQVLWNNQWLWRTLCGVLICFTLWLTTLSLPGIIAAAGTGAKTIVWGIGVIGFTILLVLLLAFVNWMLLHMKPKK
ncbi:hypothetical protein D770_10970 [Flammeovirgaceae bacterium 311]|nr:hypothetical protein D770_10970 [Flammeovirgaceae bacterium 311]